MISSLLYQVGYLWTALQKSNEREWKDKKRCQNFKLPDVWGMISCVGASFSKDWMRNAAKSVSLWASTQNGLLMPWLIVAYALCTTLADHPNTQLTVQTMHCCLRCEAKVKVTALGQTAYWRQFKREDDNVHCTPHFHTSFVYLDPGTQWPTKGWRTSFNLFLLELGFNQL